MPAPCHPRILLRWCPARAFNGEFYSNWCSLNHRTVFDTPVGTSVWLRNSSSVCAFVTSKATDLVKKSILLRNSGGFIFMVWQTISVPTHSHVTGVAGSLI